METTRRLVVHRHFDVESLGDFYINLVRSQQTLEYMTYPEHFYYPVPFLILQEGLAALGLPFASLLWCASSVISALAVLWMSLAALGLDRNPWRWALALAATLPVVYFVQWDLRAGNSNLVLLALVLLSLRLGMRRWPVAGGAGLSLAIALKLYGVVLLPYLAVRRRWRFAAASAGGLVVLFVVLPVLRLGPEGAWSLSSAWLAHLLHPGPSLALPDYYKPFERSLLLVLTAAGGRDHSVARWSPEAVVVLARIGQTLWLAAVAAQLARSRSWRDPAERLYADAAVLLLLPLPFSPTFQAHHAVVLVLTALWMVRVAVDPAETRGRRIGAVAALVAASLLVKVVDEWPARALAIQGALAIHLGALLALPPRREPEPSPAGAEADVP